MAHTSVFRCVCVCVCVCVCRGENGPSNNTQGRCINSRPLPFAYKRNAIDESLDYSTCSMNFRWPPISFISSTRCNSCANRSRRFFFSTAAKCHMQMKRLSRWSAKPVSVKICAHHLCALGAFAHAQIRSQSSRFHSYNFFSNSKVFIECSMASTLSGYLKLSTPPCC